MFTFSRDKMTATLSYLSISILSACLSYFMLVDFDSPWFLASSAVSGLFFGLFFLKLKEAKDRYISIQDKLEELIQWRVELKSNAEIIKKEKDYQQQIENDALTEIDFLHEEH